MTKRKDIMRHISWAMSYMLAVVCSIAAQELTPIGESIVSPDAKLELLYTRTAPISGGLTEGAAVAPDGSIYFSDIPVGSDRGLIMRFDPKTKRTTAFAEDSHKSNGLMFDAHGDLIACEGSDSGGRCVSRWDVKAKKRDVVADKYMGKRFNAPNDLAIDEKGRIYFTDPRYLGDEPRELAHRAVYRINTDGSVVEVTHDCEKPNGIAVSPDQKTLYVADHNNGTDKIDFDAPPPKHGAMKIYAFPLGSDGLVSGPRKTLVDFGEQAGCDGMTVDVNGNIYLTARSLKRPGVMVIDPSGQEIAFIPTGPPQPGAKEPKGMPSNVDFGIGEQSNMLYVTIDKSLYRIRLNVDGYHIPWAK
jgi:gluconolactonase